MPAASDPRPGPVTLPHTWRPLGVRLAGLGLGGLLCIVLVFAWFALGAEDRAKFTLYQLVTLILLALLALACGYAVLRSRVVALPDRLVVVNGYRRREFEYAEIVEASLAPGAPWVTLDLADGTAVSAMGIQGSDGGRAQTALDELRAVIEAATAR